jgi:hypothetical protein
MGYGGGVARELAIFNHLDIKILVHDTQKTTKFTSEPETTTDRRIVGFEVTPYSVPYGSACTPTMYSEGARQVLVDDEPFMFSYRIHVGSSEKEWPDRLDQYLSF